MKTEPLHKTLSKLVSDCHCAAYAAERARVAHGRATVEGLPNKAGRVLYAEAKIQESERLTADVLPRLDAAREAVQAAPHVAGKAAGLAALDTLTEAARLGLSPVGWESQALRDVAYQIEAAPTPTPTAEGKVKEVEWGKGLIYDNIRYRFAGVKRWDIVKLLIETKDPGGWVALPRKSRSLGTFDKGDALRFRKDAIEAAARGSGNREGRFRIRP
jgi:hypothetical protein